MIRRLNEGNPTISVKSEKSELVGAYKSGGRGYRPSDKPGKVDVHDLMSELGRVGPYTVCVVLDKSDRASVWGSADTSELAIKGICR